MKMRVENICGQEIAFPEEYGLVVGPPDDYAKQDNKMKKEIIIYMMGLVSEYKKCRYRICIEPPSTLPTERLVGASDEVLEYVKSWNDACENYTSDGCLASCLELSAAVYGCYMRDTYDEHCVDLTFEELTILIELFLETGQNVVPYLD